MTWRSSVAAPVAHRADRGRQDPAGGHVARAVAGGPQQDVVAGGDEAACQFVDDPLGAAVAGRGNRDPRRGDDGDPHHGRMVRGQGACRSVPGSRRSSGTARRSQGIGTHGRAPASARRHRSGRGSRRSMTQRWTSAVRYPHRPASQHATMSPVRGLSPPAPSVVHTGAGGESCAPARRARAAGRWPLADDPDRRAHVRDRGSAGRHGRRCRGLRACRSAPPVALRGPRRRRPPRARWPWRRHRPRRRSSCTACATIAASNDRRSWCGVVGSDGTLHEDVELWATGREPVTVALSAGFAADFAHLFDVKAGRGRPATTPNATLDGFEFRDPDWDGDDDRAVGPDARRARRRRRSRALDALGATGSSAARCRSSSQPGPAEPGDDARSSFAAGDPLVVRRLPAWGDSGAERHLDGWAVVRGRGSGARRPRRAAHPGRRSSRPHRGRRRRAVVHDAVRPRLAAHVVDAPAVRRRPRQRGPGDARRAPGSGARSDRRGGAGQDPARGAHARRRRPVRVP